MFSNDFMRFLINYQPDGIEAKPEPTVKEINFKSHSGGKKAEVFVILTQK